MLLENSWASSAICLVSEQLLAWVITCCHSCLISKKCAHWSRVLNWVGLKPTFDIVALIFCPSILNRRKRTRLWNWPMRNWPRNCDALSSCMRGCTMNWKGTGQPRAKSHLPASMKSDCTFAICFRYRLWKHTCLIHYLHTGLPNSIPLRKQVRLMLVGNLSRNRERFVFKWLLLKKGRNCTLQRKPPSSMCTEPFDNTNLGIGACDSQEAEDSRAQAAQKLSSLCTSILQVNLQGFKDVSSLYRDSFL